MLSVFLKRRDTLFLMATIKSWFNGYTPAFIWWLIVLVLMCTPGNDLPELGSWTELIKLDKIIHVGIFSLMGYLFMRPVYKRDLPAAQKQNYFLKIAICISLWGITTEFIQHFWIPGRSFDLWDWVADTIGAFLAILLSRKYLKHLQD